jgi:biopolymer transport protein ExbD
MSHAPAGQESKAEPNLTPLLDLVLQLLMFFMITVNFVSNQVNENIKLPVMQSARPADKRETEQLFLNLTAESRVEVTGRDPMPMAKPAEIKTFLRKEYGDTLRALELEKGKGKAVVKTIIVIRADKNVEYKDVYQLMRWCKEEKFTRFQLRAMTRNPDSK